MLFIVLRDLAWLCHYFCAEIIIKYSINNFVL